MILHKEHTLSSGKKIHVYDDVLPLQLRDHIFSFVANSHYKIGWRDGAQEKAISHRFLHSTYSEEDTNNCGLLPFLTGTPNIAKHFKNKKLEKSIVNLSVPSDTNFVHAHPESLVILYYANLDWENHWFGETLFFSENLKNIELASPYTPGRIIIFDGSIPHTIRPQSVSADHYRFTCAITFI